jgi:hypothetical protein
MQRCEIRGKFSTTDQARLFSTDRAFGTLKNNTMLLNPELNSGLLLALPLARVRQSKCKPFCQRQNRYQSRMQRSKIRGKFSTTDQARLFSTDRAFGTLKNNTMLLNPELHSGLLLALPLARGQQSKQVQFF